MNENDNAWLDLVEYSRSEKRGRPKLASLQISVPRGQGKTKPQVVFLFPEEVCQQCGFKIGDRLTLKWRADFRGAVIERCSYGYILSAFGGKGSTKKMLGQVARGRFKMVSDDELMTHLFPKSTAAYCPDIAGTGDGFIRFLLPSKGGAAS